MPTPVPQAQQIKITTQNSPKASQNQNIIGNRIQQQVININQQTNENRFVNSPSISQPQN